MGREAVRAGIKVRLHNSSRSVTSAVHGATSGVGKTDASSGVMAPALHADEIGHLPFGQWIKRSPVMQP